MNYKINTNKSNILDSYLRSNNYIPYIYTKPSDLNFNEIQLFYRCNGPSLRTYYCYYLHNSITYWVPEFE